MCWLLALVSRAWALPLVSCPTKRDGSASVNVVLPSLSQHDGDGDAAVAIYVIGTRASNNF